MVEKERGDNSPKFDCESEDCHWVETLFPPHFSLLTLVGENNICVSGKAGAVKVTEPSSSLSSQRRLRRQDIYKTTLQIVQHKEAQRRKEAPFQKIIKDDLQKEIGELSSEHEGHRNQGGDRGWDGEVERSRCIWNIQDIGVLRKAIHEVEEDRCRMRAKLSEAMAEAQMQGKERKCLQGLLEEREEQLGLARQEAARRALHVDALQAEGHKMAVQLQAQATQAKDITEEKMRLREKLKKVSKEVQEVRRENETLALDIERLGKQLTIEVQRQEEVSRLEHDIALQRLQRDLEETKTQLKLEKESHTRSYTALEFLRRHFNNPSQGTTHTLTEKIAHI
ncbi:hypothetical protein J4Q44_G00312200 [Coregonus suidteri]|uniref:Uncharacterized protein n=1 Tax=Coregonus suidteri TaxID=861788 RepID=A0AAN8L584_9TELE